MIDKEELIERIENTLTTRTVKELFKSLVEQCRDVPIPKKNNGHTQILGENGTYSRGWCDGWNACIDAMRGEEK